MTPRILYLIGAIVLLVFLWAFTLWVIYDPPCIQRTEWSEQEKQYVINRMKYHGISGCIKDETGYHFYRKGKKVKL
jgi:hypothetical protein